MADLRGLWLAAGLVFAALASAGTGRGTAAVAGDVTVTVTGVRSGDGQVAGALFDSAGTWLEGDRKAAGARMPAARGSVELVFEDVPPGSYGIAVYHDENGNGEFDTSGLGLPIEGLGFSNGGRVSLFGPPAFEAARVTVGDGPTAFTVEMRY